MSLTIAEAAHMLRMTTAFLRWCRGHAPKNDGRKLRFNQDGTLEEGELAGLTLTFGEHGRTNTSVLALHENSNARR